MNSPWTDHLANSGATFVDHGIRFDSTNPPDNAVIAVPLLHLGLIRAIGEDSAAFLHNLFSNDVKKLGPDAAQWNSFNTPKGRMLASLLIWSETDGHLIALSADILPAMLKKLSMYVLRSKVRLDDASSDIALIGVSGEKAQSVLERAAIEVPGTNMHQTTGTGWRCVRLGELNHVVAVNAADAPTIYQTLLDSGAQKADTAAWQLAMIRAGLPLITAATQEEFVAQMLNYEVIGGVSFNKGCYPGQEIVARTQYLGKLKKRMYRVRMASDTTPTPGTDLFTPEFGDQSAGKLVNVARAADGGFEALAVLQSSCANSGEIHLGSPQGPHVAVLELPYSLP